jgi:hypothetical protein
MSVRAETSSDKLTDKSRRLRGRIPLSLRVWVTALVLLTAGSALWVAVPAYRHGAAIREIEHGGGIGSFTEPNGSSSENSHPSSAEPIAKVPRPTDPHGKEIPPRGHAPKELLIEFKINEDGLATDEQVEAQLKIFSISEFSGWNQNDGWSVWLAVDQIGALKKLGLVEAQLKEPSSGFGGRINWESWQISPSYRLQLTYDFALRENTRISFPKANLRR